MYIVSECCNATIKWGDICSACGEHCDEVDLDEEPKEEEPQIDTETTAREKLINDLKKEQEDNKNKDGVELSDVEEY